MIERRHDGGGRQSRALYSRCGTYRYLLEREWGEGGKLLYILLNPSTATEERNDPTLERCERRARALDFGGFAVANLFAYRATRPEDLRRADAPVGPDNDDALLLAAQAASAVLCGWGVHGTYRGRNSEVMTLLSAADIKPFHLGLTRAGHPRHPLYVPYMSTPQQWTLVPEIADNPN